MSHLSLLTGTSNGWEKKTCPKTLSMWVGLCFCTCKFKQLSQCFWHQLLLLSLVDPFYVLYGAQCATGIFLFQDFVPYSMFIYLDVNTRKLIEIWNFHLIFILNPKVFSAQQMQMNQPCCFDTLRGKYIWFLTLLPIVLVCLIAEVST